MKRVTRNFAEVTCCQQMKTLLFKAYLLHLRVEIADHNSWLHVLHGTIMHLGSCG